MEIKIVTSWKEVTPHKEIWNGILEDIDSDIVYMTFEWLYKWWEYHSTGKELFILEVIQDDKILGFCPLMKIPAKGYEEIRFIGGDETGYMGFIVRDKFREKFIAEILDFLIDLQEKFLINIHGISQGTKDYEFIKIHFKEREQVFLETSLESYYIDIDGQEFDVYLKTRFGRGSINTMKRKERRLKRLGKVSYRPINKGQEEIDIAFNIHDKRWQRKIGSSKFSIGETRGFFKGLALSEDLPFDTRLDIVEINNRIISFIYGFQYKGRYIFYRIAHDDHYAIFSPGEIVLREMIRDCFDKKLRVFDFGLGFEPYKAAWTAKKVDVSGFLFPSDNRFARTKFRIHQLKWDIRQTIRANPRIYHFVKYRLGKIKFFFYPENTKRVCKKGFLKLKDKIREVFAFLYWTDDYYIMYRTLNGYQGNTTKIYRVEEATVEKLDLLLDITLMDPSNILRRLLKGDRCLLIYDDQDASCLWLDTDSLNIEEVGYSLAMDRKAVYISDFYPSKRKAKIKRKILNPVLEYLKEQGYDECYTMIMKKNNHFMGLLKNEGFKQFTHIKLKRRFGRSATSEYKGSLE